MIPVVDRFETSLGQPIYRLPLEAFPGFWANAYLVLMDQANVLVDTGSGSGNANDQLNAGLEAVRETYNEDLHWEDITHILISHGHLDHFGGLPYLQQQSPALAGVHSLDLPVLINYEVRLEMVERRLWAFLEEAGLSDGERQELMEMYMVNKSLFASVPVDFTFESVGMQLGPLEIVHTPGHCPGQVVMKLDDVLLSSDHLLPDISPHQSPESLSLASGLGHYLSSLEHLRGLSPEIRLILPGHGEPLHDLEGRIQEIQAVHLRRLDRLLALMEEPRTIAQASRQLFPSAAGYHRLLALEETGAHVEFLHSRGFIGLANGQHRDGGQGALFYQQLKGSPATLPNAVGSTKGISTPSDWKGRIDV